MNTFGEYLKEELGSTSKGSGLIDLSLENQGPASSKVLKGIIEVKINKMIEKIKPIKVGGDGPKMTNQLPFVQWEKKGEEGRDGSIVGQLYCFS